MYWLILFAGLFGDVNVHAQTTQALMTLEYRDKTIDRAFDMAVKNLHLDEKTKLQILYKTLDAMSEENLYFLKATPDACATPEILQCDGLPSATVKPFIEMALDKRKAKHSAEDAQRTYALSWWAFLVSALSLGIAVLDRFRTWIFDRSRQAA